MGNFGKREWWKDEVSGEERGECGGSVERKRNVGMCRWSVAIGRKQRGRKLNHTGTFTGTGKWWWWCREKR